MMTIADLILLAERMGVRVLWAKALSAPAMYRHRDRTIWLRDGRSDRATRCSLAHELGHAHYGHEVHGHYAAQERQADAYAAELLITPESYREAERVVGHHLHALANELEVTVALVSAWQRFQRKTA